MGAMKRMARFFYGSSALRREDLPNSQPDESKTSDFHRHELSVNRTVVITETTWREAPRKYQNLVEQGQTIRVEDDQGTVIIVLASSTLSIDASVEKEMQNLLDRCTGDRIHLSGSWLE